MRNPTAGAGNGSAEPNEQTGLLGSMRGDSGTPLYEDERPWVKWPSHFVHKTYQTLASNYVNVLLFFVPLGIIAGAMGWNPTAVFVLNFFAIIPLAALLSFATEEISAKLGQTLAGLMNATFGNAVELIVGVLMRIWFLLISWGQWLTRDAQLTGQHSGVEKW